MVTQATQESPYCRKTGFRQLCKAVSVCISIDNELQSLRPVGVGYSCAISICVVVWLISPQHIVVKLHAYSSWNVFFPCITLINTSHALHTGASGERECLWTVCNHSLFCSDQVDGLLKLHVDTAAQSWHFIGCYRPYNDVFLSFSLQYICVSWYVQIPCAFVSSNFMGHIRESVDSLCRDGTDTTRPLSHIEWLRTPKRSSYKPF